MKTKFTSSFIEFYKNRPYNVTLENIITELKTNKGYVITDINNVKYYCLDNDYTIGVFENKFNNVFMIDESLKRVYFYDELKINKKHIVSIGKLS